jgi:hypothetical protein
MFRGKKRFHRQGGVEAVDGMVVEKAWMMIMMREAFTPYLREGSGKSVDDDEGGIHATPTRMKDAALGVGSTRS